MNEKMMRDIENDRLEREYYLSRRKQYYERQAQLFNILPKLFIPLVLALIAMMLLEPTKNLITQYERILAAEARGMERIPELKKQIATLEKQIVNLSNQSIEKRLSIIEKSISVGDIDVEEVATLQELKSNFDILKTYMFSDPEDLVKLKTLQRDYQEMSTKIDKYVHKDDVSREISFLTNMFYTVLGFIGILISIAGGSWWSTSRKLKDIRKENNKEET